MHGTVDHLEAQLLSKDDEIMEQKKKIVELQRQLSVVTETAKQALNVPTNFVEVASSFSQ